MSTRSGAYTLRQRALLEMAVEKFREWSDPFSTTVLNEHEITLDEAMWLSEEIGVILDMFLSTER